MNERAREIFVKLASGKNSTSETTPTAKLAALVKLARTGYAPAAVILKRRAMTCPEHKAALAALLNEANAPASNPPAPKAAPALRRDTWVATAPPKPPEAVSKPAAAVPTVVTCEPAEWLRMDSQTRRIFLESGGTCPAAKGPLKVEISIARSLVNKSKR